MILICSSRRPPPAHPQTMETTATPGPSTISDAEVDPLIGWCLTHFVNFTGHPAVSIEAGLCNGLPIGMQIKLLAGKAPISMCFRRARRSSSFGRGRKITTCAENDCCGCEAIPAAIADAVARKISRASFLLHELEESTEITIPRATHGRHGIRCRNARFE